MAERLNVALVQGGMYDPQPASQNLQPKILINNRIGIPGDYETPKQLLPAAIPIKGTTLDFDHKNTGTDPAAVPSPEELIRLTSA